VIVSEVESVNSLDTLWSARKLELQLTDLFRVVFILGRYKVESENKFGVPVCGDVRALLDG